MQFKELKQNYPVYILDKQEFAIIQGKATAVSFPRLEVNPKNGKTEMVVDVTVEANGNTATYTIPENLSVTYAGNLVLSMDKQSLMPEVDNMEANADQVLTSVPNAQKIKERAPMLRSELNPIYRERQETEKRFNAIEDSVNEIKIMMSEFINKSKL